MNFEKNRLLERLEELLQERRALYELQNFSYQTETIIILKQYRDIRDLPTDMQNTLLALISQTLEDKINIIEGQIKQICQEL